MFKISGMCLGCDAVVEFLYMYLKFCYFPYSTYNSGDNEGGYGQMRLSINLN